MNEITKAEETPSTEVIVSSVSPMSLIELAISKNADVSQLEKLMDLYERWNKEEARKAFFEALSKFQSECPRIKKVKDGAKTKEGMTAYKYAPIEEVAETIQPLILKYGFSYTFNTPSIKPEGIEVEIKITHIKGHTEITRVVMPYVDRTGVMSPPQVVGATSTYAKRYAICDAFGITTADDDTDAITDSVINELNMLIENWQYKETYIVPLVESLKSKSAYRKLMSMLPTPEQTAKFIKLTEKIPTEQQRKFWTAFQQQTNQTADKFISDIETKLKLKEK